VVVVEGDIKASETLNVLETVIGGYPRRAAIMPTLPTEPAPTSVRRRVMEQEGLQRAYLLMGFRTVNLFSPDMYPLDLASYILSTAPPRD